MTSWAENQTRLKYFFFSISTVRMINREPPFVIMTKKRSLSSRLVVPSSPSALSARTKAQTPHLPQTLALALPLVPVTAIMGSGNRAPSNSCASIFLYFCLLVLLQIFFLIVDVMVIRCGHGGLRVRVLWRRAGGAGCRHWEPVLQLQRLALLLFRVASPVISEETSATGLC